MCPTIESNRLEIGIRETYHTEMSGWQGKTTFERNTYHNKFELYQISDQRPSVDNWVLEVLTEDRGNRSVVLALRVETTDDFHCI